MNLNSNYNSAYNKAYNPSSRGINNTQPSSNNSNSKNSNPAQGLDPVKLRIIEEIRTKSQGKTLDEMLPQIMKINNEMKRRNISFTKEETKLLVDELEKNVKSQEIDKFNMIKSFII